MPGNISNISTESTCGNYPWRLGYSSEQKASLGSLVPNNNDETLFQHRDIGVEKGALARFTAVVHSPVQALRDWFNSLLHGLAPKPAEFSDNPKLPFMPDGAGLTPEMYKAWLVGEGGPRSLVHDLELIANFARTPIANAARRVLDAEYKGLSACDWAQGTDNAVRMVARLAESAEKNVVQRLVEDITLSVEKDIAQSLEGSITQCVEKSRSERIAKSIAQGISDRIEEIVALGIPDRIAESSDRIAKRERIEESIERIIEDKVSKNLAKNVEISVAKVLETIIEKSVAQSIAKNLARNFAAIVMRNVDNSVWQGVSEGLEKRVVGGLQKSVEEGLDKSVVACVVTSLARGVVEDVGEKIAQKNVESNAKSIDAEQRLMADYLNQFVKSAYGVIQNRDLQASTPAPVPMDEDLADVKTWLGRENSRERLGKLREGLLGIRGKQSTSSSDTRFDAAQLLSRSISGVGMGVWIEGGQLMDDWFQEVDKEVRLEVAMKLNDWADEATELLLKSEAEKLEVKDQGQEALSLGFQYV